MIIFFLVKEGENMTKLKNTKKIIFTIWIFIYIINITKIVFGLDPTGIINTNRFGGNGSGASDLYTIGNKLLGIIQAAGAGVAVIATLVLGIRYTYSAPDDRAEIKKKLIPFIIGGVLVFGALSLVKLVETFTSDLNI